MRTYRFVNDLGRAVDAAGASVADAADVTSDHRGGLIRDEEAVESRVGGELLRQMARETDGRELERVTFDARSAQFDDGGAPVDHPGMTVGLAITIDLPIYRSRTLAIGSVLHTARLPANLSGADTHPVDDRVESLLARWPSAVMLLVTGEATRAIPARSIRAMTQPVAVETLDEHLYGRALGRFVQDLAEGFVGVSEFDGKRAGQELTPDPGGLGEWARSHGLDGVYSLAVRSTTDRTESSLASFLD
ncbi:MAG: hypothetical protein ABEJ84_00215 [Halodesulfurarchaeum sp.]